MFEAKSYTLATMYDVLTQKHLTIDPFPNTNILICNTAADQCMVTRKAWYIEAFNDRYVGCNNYLDPNSNETTCECQLVSTCTVLCGPNIKPILIRVYEGVLMDDDNQNESLLYPYQAMAD